MTRAPAPPHKRAAVIKRALEIIADATDDIDTAATRLLCMDHQRLADIALVLARMIDPDETTTALQNRADPNPDMVCASGHRIWAGNRIASGTRIDGSTIWRCAICHNARRAEARARERRAEG